MSSLGSFRRPPRPRTMVITATAGVIVGVLVFFLVLAIAGPRSTEQSQKATFKVGSAERLAKVVDREGPLLFQDLLNRSRDIYVQHLGGRDWRAFEAHAPDAPRRCALRWEPARRVFVDPCDGKVHPADGTGLVNYRAFVDDKGALIVVLSTAVTEPTTTSTS